MENNKYENKEICKKCKGECCKKCGCDYSTNDFQDLSMKALEEILKEGKTSIVAAIDIKRTKNGTKYIVPYLYLRVRNKNRGIVDLISMKSCCSVLTERGCPYSLENRPSGGVNLIPSEVKGKCYPLIDQFEIVKGWEKYQVTLTKMVKRLTGKTVDRILREDTEQLVYDIMIGNFDYVSDREKQEIYPLIRELMDIYKEECKRGMDRAQKEQTMLKLKK